MAVELATGYVSLTTEAATLAQDIRKAIRQASSGLDLDLGDAFGDLTANARSEARKAAQEFESGFQVDLDQINADVDITGLNEFAGVRSEIRSLDGSNISIDVDVESADTSNLIDDISSAGSTVADGFLGSFKPPLLGGLLAIGGLGAGLLVQGITSALQREQQEDLLAGSLGLDPEQAAAIGDLAGELYADAYGDSFEDIIGTAELAIPLAGIDNAAETIVDLENLEATFKGSAEEYAALLGLLDSQGIADVDLGTDLLISGLQNVPPAFRDNFTEAIAEYAPFAEALGLGAEEIFTLFSGLAAEGPFVLDKAGDAIKELTILSTELGAEQVAAYEAIGLSADETATAILEGGAPARQALDDIVAGLLAIEDPLAQQAAAIALFGTPLEDLGKDDIPTFLEGLGSIEEGLLGVDDASDSLDDLINDNTATRFTELWRTAQEALVEVGEAFVPLLDEAIDFFEEFSAIAEEDGIGAAFDFALETLGDLWETAQPYVDEFLSAAKTFLVEEGGPLVAEGLEAAGDALVDWILPKVSGMLLALGEATLALTTYLITDLPPLIAEALLGAGQEFVTWATNAATGAKDEVIAAVPDILQAGKDFVQGLLDGAEEIGENVITFFEDLPGDAKDGLGDVSTTLLQVGKDIIQGLFDGLKNKWTEVETWLSDRAADVAGFFTSALGIQSPSRVMMEIGEDTLEGFRLGLEAKEDVIEAQLAGIVDATIRAGTITSINADSTQADIDSTRFSTNRIINVNTSYDNAGELYQAVTNEERRDDILEGRSFAAAGDRDRG